MSEWAVDQVVQLFFLSADFSRNNPHHNIFPCTKKPQAQLWRGNLSTALL